MYISVQGHSCSTASLLPLTFSAQKPRSSCLPWRMCNVQVYLMLTYVTQHHFSSSMAPGSLGLLLRGLSLVLNINPRQTPASHFQVNALYKIPWAWFSVTLVLSLGHGWRVSESPLYASYPGAMHRFDAWRKLELPQGCWNLRSVSHVSLWALRNRE